MSPCDRSLTIEIEHDVDRRASGLLSLTACGAELQHHVDPYHSCGEAVVVALQQLFSELGIYEFTIIKNRRVLRSTGWCGAAAQFPSTSAPQCFADRVPSPPCPARGIREGAFEICAYDNVHQTRKVVFSKRRSHRLPKNVDDVWAPLLPFLILLAGKSNDEPLLRKAVEFAKTHGIVVSLRREDLELQSAGCALLQSLCASLQSLETSLQDGAVESVDASIRSMPYAFRSREVVAAEAWLQEMRGLRSASLSAAVTDTGMVELPVETVSPAFVEDTDGGVAQMVLAQAADVHASLRVRKGFAPVVPRARSRNAGSWRLSRAAVRGAPIVSASLESVLQSPVGSEQQSPYKMGGITFDGSNEEGWPMNKQVDVADAPQGLQACAEAPSCEQPSGPSDQQAGQSNGVVKRTGRNSLEVDTSAQNSRVVSDNERGGKERLSNSLQAEAIPDEPEPVCWTARSVLNSILETVSMRLVGPLAKDSDILINVKKAEGPGSGTSSMRVSPAGTACVEALCAELDKCEELVDCLEGLSLRDSAMATAKVLMRSVFSAVSKCLPLEAQECDDGAGPFHKEVDDDNRSETSSMGVLPSQTRRISTLVDELEDEE